VARGSSQTLSLLSALLRPLVSNQIPIPASRWWVWSGNFQTLSGFVANKDEERLLPFLAVGWRPGSSAPWWWLDVGFEERSPPFRCGHDFFWCFPQVELGASIGI
jgi:hypothetical protein